MSDVGKEEENLGLLAEDGHISKIRRTPSANSVAETDLESLTRRNITPFPSTLTGLEMMADLHSNVHADQTNIHQGHSEQMKPTHYINSMSLATKASCSTEHCSCH